MDLDMQRDESLIRKAGSTMKTVVRGVLPGYSGAATPCPDYDVRGLANHLLYWGPVLAAAARKRQPPQGRPPEKDATLAGDDWQDRYCAVLDDLVDAWSEPAAWEGTSSMGGGEMPARVYGGMTLAEIVIHGWDLAMATDQGFTVEPEVADAVLEAMTGMAEQGRRMGAFGPEVPVPDVEPPFDRALGLAGRDPNWRP